jgi:hypothetical protein
MDRQIKFRGQRIDNKKWEYGFYAELPTVFETGGLPDDKKHFIFTLNRLDMPPVEVIPETVGQFTGLTIEDGNDIYEDDRVLLSIPGAPDSEHEVIFTNGVFALKGDQGNLSLDRIDGKEYRIVRITGNIHENANLLNQQ